jgi:hypothetical protein
MVLMRTGDKIVLEYEFQRYRIIACISFLTQLSSSDSHPPYSIHQLSVPAPFLSLPSHPALLSSTLLFFVLPGAIKCSAGSSNRMPTVVWTSPHHSNWFVLT